MNTPVCSHSIISVCAIWIRWKIEWPVKARRYLEHQRIYWDQEREVRYRQRIEFAAEQASHLLDGIQEFRKRLEKRYKDVIVSLTWKDGGEPYLPALAAAERQFLLPTDLLARVAFQECSWRAYVINGNIKSSAGAVGMMQLEPKFFPSAGISWQQDILTAARELSRLHDVFEDWQLAVAAYNWGQGSLARYLKEDGTLPAETAKYITDVFTDVPIAGSLFKQESI
jgi:hypothetical protein